MVAFFGVGWTLLTPAFQTPDETVHFAYVQALADAHALPGSDPQGRSVSSELETASHALDTDGQLFHPEDVQPTAGPAAEAVAADALRGKAADDGTGENAASTYPPVAYGAMAVGYEVLGGTVYERLHAARIVSALMLLLTTVGAWLLAGELFGRRRLPQLVCAATTGLWPMAGFVSGSVNPDGTVLAEWAFVAWLGVRSMRHGLTRSTALGLGIVAGLALITKATSLALLPALTLVALVALVRAWPERRWGVLGHLALLGAPVIALVGGWTLATAFSGRAAYGQTSAATGAFNPTEFAVYLWQFYLPALPFMQDKRLVIPVVSELPVYNTWLGMGWGVYGWVTVWFPHWLYRVFACITVVVVAASATGVVRQVRRHGRPANSTILAVAFLGTMAVGLLAGVHLTDYNFLVSNSGYFAQGRYLLPLLPLAGLVVARACDLAPRASVVLATCWLAGLVAFQLVSMGMVLTHFYA